MPNDPRMPAPLTTDTDTDIEYFRQLASPIGRIEIVSDELAITGLNIEESGRLPRDGRAQTDTAVLVEAESQLAEYFAGQRKSFELPLRLVGTSFQQDIWSELQKLAWGKVISYGELGRASGRASAGRAVGGAVGANPIPIIVPCHRVLASNGKITGYSGGDGIPTKVWLLEHEEIAYRR